MAMAGALSLSQFPVCGSISLPKRLPRRRVCIRAMSETSSTSVSTQEEPTSDASSAPASSVTFAPPPNFKPPEPKRFAIRPDKTNEVLGALLPILFRFGTGVFASGYSFSFVSKDEIPPDQYALEINGYTVKETAKLGPRPDKPIEIYEFESCPFCRKVREIVAILDLDVLFYPCPRNGPNFRPKVLQMGGKLQFPYMVDPNTGVSMYESDDIIRYLVENYGDGNVPLSLSLGFLTTLTAGLAMLSRVGKGTTYTPAKFPPKPLKLWAYEGSPFCKLVREVLVELELPHLLVSCARGSPKRHILYQKTGHFQAPYLEDPNTGIEMFESAEIIEYLKATYALQ
ncbi:anaphase-promoting complex subunit 7 [Spatholobus suberectus]|nr:anaphase-promoting complex subunit 7 [Spatholobus suberectus]